MMRYANLLIETYSILICFCLGYHLYFHRNTMRRQKNWFIIMLTANVAMTLADMTDWIFSYRITPHTVLILNIGMVIYFMSSGMLIVSYSYYLLAYLNLPVKHIAGILSSVFGVIQIILGFCSPFTNGHLFFYIGEDFAYHRGDLFILSQVTAVFVYIIQIVLLLHNRKNLQKKEVLFLTSYIILPVIGEVLQVIFYEIALLNVCTALALLLIFINVQSSQELRIEKTEAMARAKTEFIANVSHEIRTPINAILGMNEIILRESNEENIIEYSENIRSASKKLLGIINDILDFSKIESQKMEIIPMPYHLSSLVNDLHNLIAERAERKGLRLNFFVSPEMPENLFGDEMRINQIALNLLTNAVKYTQNGFVECSIGYLEKGEDILMRVEVKDSGMGIQKDDMERLFDSFQRVDEKRNRSIEGTGLGLSIVKQLVDLMGGELSVYSTYGVGSSFVVQIPQKVLAKEPVGDYRKRIRKQESEQVVSEGILIAPEARVLAVDDNEMNLKVLQGLIKRTRIQMDLAESGQEAINKVQQTDYDLVLLDHRMPHMDGVETLKIMKERNLLGTVPVIALTANAVSGAREMYIQNGFQDYLSKPISGDRLEELLKKWLPAEKILQDVPKEEETAGDIQEDSETSTEKSLAQITRDLESVLDIALAMEYAGKDREGFLMNLAFFCDNFETLENSIVEDFENKDYENYGTHVHSLKSNALTIGAKDLSDKAKELEFACTEMRTDEVEKGHPALIEKYRSLVGTLRDKGYSMPIV